MSPAGALALALSLGAGGPLLQVSASGAAGEPSPELASAVTRALAATGQDVLAAVPSQGPCSPPCVRLSVRETAPGHFKLEARRAGSLAATSLDFPIGSRPLDQARAVAVQARLLVDQLPDDASPSCGAAEPLPPPPSRLASPARRPPRAGVPSAPRLAPSLPTPVSPRPAPPIAAIGGQAKAGDGAAEGADEAAVPAAPLAPPGAEPLGAASGPGPVENGAPPPSAPVASAAPVPEEAPKAAPALDEAPQVARPTDSQDRLAIDVGATILGNPEADFRAWGILVGGRAGLGEIFEAQFSLAQLTGARGEDSHGRYRVRPLPLALCINGRLPGLPNLRAGLGAEIVSLVVDRRGPDEDFSATLWSPGAVARFQYRRPFGRFALEAALQAAYHPEKARATVQDAEFVYPSWTLSMSLGMGFGLL